MLYTTSVMADQIGKCNEYNTLPIENVFIGVNAIKSEECEDMDFVDDKVQITETVVTTDVLDNLVRDKIKQNDMSITLDNIKTEVMLPETQCDMIDDKFKIEESVTADNIRIKFNDGLLYCEDCQVYRENYCVECEMLVHILNKTVPIDADNKSGEELPNDILEIRDYFGEYRIFALKVIPAGVKFGPFTGLNTADFPWKIKDGKFLINKDKSMHLNWMQYINPARNISKRNLKIFQCEHNLYYESTCQIEGGDELLVHFGEEYEDSLNRNVEMDFVPTTEHIFKDAFACTFCCLGFSSKSYLAKHKTICPENSAGEFTIEGLMQCPSCKIHLDQKEYLTHHMVYCCKMKDRKSILLTPDNRATEVNRRKTGQEVDLNHTSQHYEVKLNEYNRTCNTSDYKANLKSELMTNIDTQHLKELKHKCDTCDYRTNKKVNLILHVQSIHLKEFKYKCDTCEYKTNQRGKLKAHVDTKHLKEFKYKCDTCDYKANLQYHLKSHIETKHSEESKYKCDICNYRACIKSRLNEHIKIHLQEFKYKCDICDYKTNVESRLKIHLEKVHLKEFKYGCDKCDYKSSCKSNLRVHKKSKHLKEFKYKCETCDYKSNLKSHLKAHVEAIHLKESKYKCDLCDYATSWKFYLKTHRDVKHSEEYKYKCDTCEYKTQRQYSFKIHIQTRHLKEFKYKCDTCDYKTNRKDCLKAHVETKHV